MPFDRKNRTKEQKKLCSFSYSFLRPLPLFPCIPPSHVHHISKDFTKHRKRERFKRNIKDFFTRKNHSLIFLYLYHFKISLVSFSNWSLSFLFDLPHLKESFWIQIEWILKLFLKNFFKKNHFKNSFKKNIWTVGS